MVQVNSLLFFAFRLTKVFVPSTRRSVMVRSLGEKPNAPEVIERIFSSVSMFVFSAIVEHPSSAKAVNAKMIPVFVTMLSPSKFGACNDKSGLVKVAPPIRGYDRTKLILFALDQARIARTQLGRVPAEKHRLIGGVATVQLLGVSSNTERFSEQSVCGRFQKNWLSALKSRCLDLWHLSDGGL